MTKITKLSFFYNGSLVYLQKVLKDGKYKSTAVAIAVTYDRDKATPAGLFKVGELQSIYGRKICNSEQRVILSIDLG